MRGFSAPAPMAAPDGDSLLGDEAHATRDQPRLAAE